MRDALWRASKWPAMLVLCMALGACSVLQGARLWLPESNGFEAVQPDLYVEAGMPDEARTQLRDAIGWARVAIGQAYGGVRSSPVAFACYTEECYTSFGGRGSKAKVYGDHILLSPRGLNRHFLAHEWSHAELHHRITIAGCFRLPSWFDEGLAVAISQAPEHSEEHWQTLARTGVARPSRGELMKLESKRQWIDAVHRYGEHLNAQRKARGEPPIAPLYAAAGHEVRPWLAHAGTAGLSALIERINGGADFDAAYRSGAPRLPSSEQVGSRSGRNRIVDTAEQPDGPQAIVGPDAR